MVRHGRWSQTGALMRWTRAYTAGVALTSHEELDIMVTQRMSFLMRDAPH